MKKGGGRHAAKLILFFALAFVSVESSAQLNTRTRQIRFATGVQFAADTAETAENIGRIWYDFNTQKFRVNEDGTNSFMSGGAGAGSYWNANDNTTISDPDNQMNIIPSGELSLNFGLTFSPLYGFGVYTAATNPATNVGIDLRSVGDDIRIWADNAGNIVDIRSDETIRLSSDIDLVPLSTDSELYSGTYTPTLTNISNAQDLTANQHNYLRVGNVVSVSGAIETTPTAVATVIVGISLPIASNFTNGYDASGPAICWTVAGAPVGSITASVTNDILELQYLPTSSGANHRYFYTLNYVVK